MEFDEAAKRRILALSDKQLAELIAKISEAAGGDPRRAGALLNDISSVRRTLEGMTPRDAEKMLGAAGREKSEAIYNIIKEAN